MTVSVKDVCKGIALVGVTIGATVAAQDKLEEYTEEHEIDNFWELTKGLGYMFFIDGLYSVGAAVAYGMLVESIDAYAMIGNAVKTAVKAVSTAA